MPADNDWDQFVIIDPDVTTTTTRRNRHTLYNVYDPNPHSIGLYGILFSFSNISLVKRLLCGAMYCVINLVSKYYLFDEND